METPASNLYKPNFDVVENTRFGGIGFGYGKR